MAHPKTHPKENNYNGTATTLYLNKELKEALKEVAAENDRSISYIVNKAVREYFIKSGKALKSTKGQG